MIVVLSMFVVLVAFVCVVLLTVFGDVGVVGGVAVVCRCCGWKIGIVVGAVYHICFIDNAVGVGYVMCFQYVRRCWCCWLC